MKSIANLSTFNEIIKAQLFSHDQERPALIIDDEVISFGLLRQKVDLFTQNLINLGVRKGSVVGYSMHNCPETYYLLIAISRLGACAVPLFHLIPAPGRISIFLNCRAEIIIASETECKNLKEAAVTMNAPIKVVSLTPCNEADAVLDYEISQIDIEEFVVDTPEVDLPFMMASSSGTTGKQKFVCMTQGNGSSVLKSSCEMALPAEERYSCVLAFPLCTSGILVLTGMMLAGVTQIASADMSPIKYLDMIQKWKAGSMAAPPAYFENILQLPMLSNYDTSSIKRIFSGMDFLSNKLIERLRTNFTNISFAAVGYGLVETATVVMIWKAKSTEALNSPTNELYLVESAGNKIEVCNSDGEPLDENIEGELWIQGAGVIKQYAGNIDENKTAFVDGWFRTGDYAKKIGPNKIALLGRRKYLIKRGGKSVSPILVKEVIEKLADVKSAAVVGVPHELYGEMIWAYVVKNETSSLKSGNIMRVCREELPPYMVPDNISFIDAIPKNPGVGKVNFEILIEKAKKELSILKGDTNV